MDQILVRRMRIDELEAVQNLYARQIETDDNPLSEIACNPRKHAWEMRRIRQQLLADQRYLAFVAIAENAIAENAIVGYAAAVIERQSRLLAVDTVACIDELWVEPQWRRHGIASTLLDALFQNIQILGIDWVKVHFPNDNDEARALFSKRGFTQKNVEMQRKLEGEN